MIDATERFALHLTQDGTVSIELGHSFDPADVAALVAAENALRNALPTQRAAVERVAATS